MWTHVWWHHNCLVSWSGTYIPPTPSANVDTLLVTFKLFVSLWPESYHPYLDTREWQFKQEVQLLLSSETRVSPLRIQNLQVMYNLDRTYVITTLLGQVSPQSKSATWVTRGLGSPCIECPLKVSQRLGYHFHAGDIVDEVIILTSFSKQNTLSQLHSKWSAREFADNY